MPKHSQDELIRMGFQWRAGDYPLITAKIKEIRKRKRELRQRGIRRAGLFVSTEILSAAERGLAMEEPKRDGPKEPAILTAMDKRLIEILQLLKSGMDFTQAREALPNESDGLTQAEQSRLASILLSI